jgi:DNA-binding NarL/FixJ family response regulator
MSKLQKKISILVADDHTLFRSGIISILKEYGEFELIGEAADGDELIRKYFSSSPDIMLVDISMPVISGTEAVKQILMKDSEAKALFLSMFEGEEYIYHILKIGGRGLINKNIMEEDLIKAIKTVHEGGMFFDNGIDDEKIEDILFKYDKISKDGEINKDALLNYREAQILNMIGSGSTSQDIANRLQLSKRTVDAYRSNLMKKLDISTVGELIKYAISFKERNHSN